MMTTKKAFFKEVKSAALDAPRLFRAAHWCVFRCHQGSDRSAAPRRHEGDAPGEGEAPSPGLTPGALRNRLRRFCVWAVCIVQSSVGLHNTDMTRDLPTVQAYAELQSAYDFFNAALFEGQLPPCLMTLQRKGANVRGYFSAERFGHLGEPVRMSWR